VQVLHRRLDVGVAHPLLDAADIGLTDHARAEGVAEVVIVPTSAQGLADSGRHYQSLDHRSPGSPAARHARTPPPASRPCPSRKPTTGQLAYLKALAHRTGHTFTYPTTLADASAEITRLRSATPSSRPERRIEHKLIADQMQAGSGDATRVRDDEIAGRGADATWAHHRRQPDASAAPPPVTRKTPQVGARTELARYTIPAGQRILYGQRVDGVVRITDRPVASGGRAYLVDCGLETKQEPETLVADNIQVAAETGEVPAGHLPLERYLDTLR
jgi:hypothetical protein